MSALPPKDRFWSKVQKGGPGDCWEWMGCRNQDGYGLLETRLNGVKVRLRAHRVAFEFYNQVDPGDLLVRHMCDNRACCNPAHLDIGTVYDNNRDMLERNRYAKGASNYQTKLTAEQVIAIRAEHNPDKPGASIQALSRKHGVGRTTIYHIIAGRTWAWITDQSFASSPDIPPTGRLNPRAFEACAGQGGV